MRTEKAEQRIKEIRNRKTPYDVVVGGLALAVFEHVYPTSEVSELLVACMDDVHRVGPESAVLDYGTGTGFLAIQAALRGARVVATDVNPHAIACAKQNALRHGVDGVIDFRCGDAVSMISAHETFDLILAGMPWDDAEPNDMLERALYDPGFAMRRALFNNAARHLKPGGAILLTSAEGAMERHCVPEWTPSFSLSIVREKLIKDVPHYAVMAVRKI